MKLHNCLVLGLALSVSLSAQAGTFSGWTLNGSATTVDEGNTLRLTDAAQTGVAGTAWAPGLLSLHQDFSIQFSFKLYGGTPGDPDPTWQGDGLTFTLHTDPNGSSALGGAGGGIGLSGIGPSASFVFDTFVPNSGDLVASAIGGDTDENSYINPVAPGVNGDSLRNSVLYAWVDFSAANQELKLFLNDSNLKPSTEIQWLGTASWEELYFQSSQFYVGFTSSTGSATDTHEILSYSVTPVPVPSAGWMFGSAMLGLLGLRRRPR